MNEKFVTSFDFASLYPTTMRDFSDLLTKEMQRQKQELRKRKLEQIQKLSDDFKQT